MDIKEYLERNLPNVNFNILPQLFEEEGIELTEEIVEYLKTTPWNTNWNIFNSIIPGTTEVKKIILQISSGTIESSDFNSAQEIYEYCENHKYTYEDDYGETHFAAQGIEIYHEYSEEPLQLYSNTDVPDVWSTYYLGNGWSAIWGVQKINGGYDYLFNMMD